VRCRHNSPLAMTVWQRRRQGGCRGPMGVRLLPLRLPWLVGTIMMLGLVCRHVLGFQTRLLPSITRSHGMWHGRGACSSDRSNIRSSSNTFRRNRGDSKLLLFSGELILLEHGKLQQLLCPVLVFRKQVRV